MKKLFIVVGLIYSAAGTSIKAQETEKVIETKPSFHVIEFGVRYMPTFSSFNINTSAGGTVIAQTTLGYGIGGFIEFNLSKHVGIQGEVIYNSLLQKYKDQNLEREIHVDYVNVPLLLSLNTGKSNPVNLNVVFGPQYGVNVGSRLTGPDGNTLDTLTGVLAVKKNDLDVAYGAGLEFALNSSRSIRLDLGFRGALGFVNISNTNQRRSNSSYNILDRTAIETYSGYAGITLSF